MSTTNPSPQEQSTGTSDDCLQSSAIPLQELKNDAKAQLLVILQAVSSSSIHVTTK